MSAVSGHVFRYEGNRRPVWQAKYRLPDGRQVIRRSGRRGPRAVARRPATSPSAQPRHGSAACSPKPRPERTPEEVLALVRAADSEQGAALYLTAAFTGLRQGELIALRWRDVDLAGSAIRVRASCTNGHSRR